MKPVKCHFKNISDADKQKFKQSKCLLTVSVGQAVNEGESLVATLKLVGECFSSCIILLYDSLQRYTMALNNHRAPEYFHSMASQEGQLWIDRNVSYIEALTIPVSYSFWDVWLAHPDYANKKEILQARLKEDPAYQASFDLTIDKYITRLLKNIPDITQFDRERAESLCFQYVLEECAVLCLWPELHCQYEIYASQHNPAMRATRERFVTAISPNCLQPLSMRFRNAPQQPRQQFITKDILQ